jgi:hypothetical protein
VSCVGRHRIGEPQRRHTARTCPALVSNLASGPSFQILRKNPIRAAIATPTANLFVKTFDCAHHLKLIESGRGAARVSAVRGIRAVDAGITL